MSIEDIIEEPAGGHNALHGYKVSLDVGARASDGRVRVPLDTEEQLTREFLMDSGFSIVDTGAGTHTGGTQGYLDAGMTTHRGVLHPDEYVDHEALVFAVERALGFTLDDLHAVYVRGGGPLPNNLRQQREAIDARLLALSLTGANMVKLAEVTGLAYRTVKYALARAREVQAA